jgi:hypothetical protein
MLWELVVLDEGDALLEGDAESAAGAELDVDELSDAGDAELEAGDGLDGAALLAAAGSAPEPLGELDADWSAAGAVVELVAG